MTQQYDVAVIGLGAAGGATALALAKGGAKVVGIDRFHPPHHQGSSHGGTRFTRSAIGEGDVYVPLVRRSNLLWQQLEAETGVEITRKTGGLLIASPGGRGSLHRRVDFLGRTVEVAGSFAIPHERLDATEIGRRYPHFTLRGDETAYFEPDAGILFPERCIEAQLKTAKGRGARLMFGRTATHLDRDGAGMRVTLDDGTRVNAGRVVVAAGGWIAQLLGKSLAGALKVFPQASFWFRQADKAASDASAFPVFVWMHENGMFYGFPATTPGGEIKLATEQYDDQVETPDDAVLSEEDLGRRLVDRHLQGRFMQIASRWTRAAVCTYTLTADGDFLIDRHPDDERIIVVSACSGHGFKHAPAVGEMAASLALDPAARALAEFSFR